MSKNALSHFFKVIITYHCSFVNIIDVFKMAILYKYMVYYLKGVMV